MAAVYVLALDQGTTSSRAIVFDRGGRAVAAAQTELGQHYPQPGWVEHDPEEIWSTQLDTARAALQRAGLDWRQIAAVGITNQRETTLVWDRQTGQPLHPAIVWQCRRTADRCRALRDAGWAEPVRQKTGLVLDPYFSASKLQWLLERVPGLRARAERGEAMFGTVDTWLLWRLTGGRVHATDCSNAARTMLFNLHTLDWDDELLREFGVPRAMLPSVATTAGPVGETDPRWLGGPVPVTALVGDQQAALFGQCCFLPGMAKNTYGTGCFLLMHTGGIPVGSDAGLLTTVAWNLGGRVEYALEGSVFIAGAAVQWLRDELGLIRSAGETEALARSVPDNGGIYLVPAFVGLGAPHWDAYARGTITGLTRGAGCAHLARSALEAIAYQSRDVLDLMAREAGLDLGRLRVDGGAAANCFLLQFQADLLDQVVERPAVLETTALGAAYLAGLGAGLWAGQSELAALWQAEATFAPNMTSAERARLYAGWQQAVRRTLSAQ